MNKTVYSNDITQPDTTAWFVHHNNVVPENSPGWMSDVLRLLGGDTDSWADSCSVQNWRVRRGTTFYREASMAQAIYVVRFGSFKCLKTGVDGYEHVLGFAGVGEVLGFEALAQAQQPYDLVALEESSVFALPLRELDTWRKQCPALDYALQRALSGQLARAGDIAEMMAPVASEVRLARFLVWYSSRMAARGQSSKRFLLRMNRRDIASLLAVAHETISRGFGLLADLGYVRADIREIEILDLEGLKACTRRTRRDMDENRRKALSSRSAHLPKLGSEHVMA